MAANPDNTIKLQPGEYLIREKTSCEALYIIKEGQLEVFRTGSGGEKVIIGMISSGEYVGETALFKGTPNSSNVVALSPVTAIRLPKASIEAQLKTAPPWLVGLIRGLIERLHNANDVMRRNVIIDEKLTGRIKAVEDKFKKAE